MSVMIAHNGDQFVLPANGAFNLMVRVAECQPTSLKSVIHSSA
jgi:hypothetical protein